MPNTVTYNDSFRRICNFFHTLLGKTKEIFSICPDMGKCEWMEKHFLRKSAGAASVGA